MEPEPEKDAYYCSTSGRLVTLSCARPVSGFLFLCWRRRARGERNGYEINKVETRDDVFTQSNGNLERVFVSTDGTKIRETDQSKENIANDAKQRGGYCTDVECPWLAAPARRHSLFQCP